MVAAAERRAAAACAGDGRLHLPPGPGDRSWPGSWSPTAGSARSGTCARSTCRTGSPTRRRRCRGGWTRRRPARVRSGDIGAHIVDLAQFVTGRVGHRGLRGCWRRSSRSARSPRRPPACTARPAPRRGPVTVDDAAIFLGRLSGGGLGDVRGDPVRAGAARTRSGSRSTARAGSLAFDFEDMNVLHFFDAAEPAAEARVPPDRRHRARAPLRRRVVAAGSRPRLRARVHPPGGRPGHAPSPRGAQPAPSLRRRPAVQRVLDAVERVGRRTTARWTPMSHERRADHGATDHPVHRPVGRPAVRGGRAAGRRVGLRRPRDRLLGRPPRPLALGRRRRYVAGQLGAARAATA